MKYDPEIHRRRTIRLKEYDYSQPGAYFVTICAWNKECIFGDVIDGEVSLNEYGQMVTQEWMNTGTLRPNVVLDQYVVMPNHFHGILIINENKNPTVGARRCLALAPDKCITPDKYPTPYNTDADKNVTTRNNGAMQNNRTSQNNRAIQPNRATHRIAPTLQPNSLGSIIGQFKSVVTKQINRLRNKQGHPVWQRNYYEHIIRNEKELNSIREYIINNPLQWDLDENNPKNIKPIS